MTGSELQRGPGNSQACLAHIRSRKSAFTEEMQEGDALKACPSWQLHMITPLNPVGVEHELGVIWSFETTRMCLDESFVPLQDPCKGNSLPNRLL